MTPERLKELENRLWEAADELRANSGLTAQEYARPLLGLIFLRYAEARFVQAKEEIDAARNGSSRRRRSSSRKAEFQERGVMFVPEKALYSSLLELPEGDNISEAVVNAMKAIERENPALKDVLPKTYRRIQDDTLANLLKYVSWIPVRTEGDAFGQIYEYFLGKFAMEAGRGGGEFFTPTSIVKLMVEIIEPFHGQVYDPACGSGGMFVQSARFVEEHSGSPSADLTVFGQEKTRGTIRLAKMNLAIHGLEGIIRQGNSYYEDEHSADKPFDFVMANPPFNVDKVDKERLKDDPRFPLGMPSVDNANYLWVQLFLSALNDTGRAGFVMPNSAADARHSEQTLRRRLIEQGVVDAIVSVGSNFFYTVTLPCTLWFLDKGKRGTEREDQVLFIDARKIYNQIDRAHRDFTPEQIRFIANIARLYRGEDPEQPETLTAEALPDDMRLPAWDETFPDGDYRDVPGLCKVATRQEIEEQGWSLNPGRYVGIAERETDDIDFQVRLEELNEELETLNAEAHALEEQIAGNVVGLIEGSDEEVRITS